MTMFSKERCLNEKGFSLVELLVAVMIFVILLMGVLFLFEFGLTNAGSLRTRSTMNIEASNVMEKMLRQIRCARKFKVPTVIEGMEDMDRNYISFVADVTGVGPDKNVMFYRTISDNLLSTCEKEDTGGNWTYTELLKQTTGLTFTYWSGGGIRLGNAITEDNRMSIKRVDITLTMRKTFNSDTSPIEITKTGSVFIRSKLVSLLGGEE